MNYSLRRILLITLLPTATLIWAATAALSYHDARSEIAELLDAEMAQSARFLLALADGGLNPDTLALAETEHIVLGSDAGDLEHRYEKKLARQLWLGHSRLLLRSADAPQEPLSATGNGYSMAAMGNKTWHVYSQTDATGRFIVHIGQSADARQKITDDITRDLLLQFFVGMPLMAAVIWFCIGYVLRPLAGLVREVERREDKLLTPLHVEHIPREVKPLADAFNRLLERLALVFDHERRFTADAAHELRTPLAGIKTQADVALRAKDDEVRNKALQQIKNGVERTDHLIGQLLTLARLDPETSLMAPRLVDLSEVVRFTVTQLETLAMDKGIRLRQSLSHSQRIKGHPQMLEVLARNLLDNAIRYTPEGGQAVIATEDTAKTVRLSVEDSGPGIPEAAREAVFQRFYRYLETARQQPGSGLGLSIAERIAKLHGATLELQTSAWGGLKVVVEFPVSGER